VGPIILHRTTGLVRDGDYAVHVRELLEQVCRGEALRDILARLGGAIDGADDRDVVARAITIRLGPLRPAIESHERAHFLGRRARRTIAAKSVIALEGVGGDIVYVYPIARLDRL